MARTAIPRTAIVMVCMVLAAPACTTTARKPSPPASSSAAGPPPAGYRVGTGDELALRAGPGKPERTVTVAADGSLHVPGHESLRVDGLTASEIAEAIASEWGEPFRASQVTVTRCASQVIHLFGGDAGEPARAVPYRGPETVEEFLDRIGFRQRRRGYRVRVVRAGKSLEEPTQILATQTDRGHRERNASVRPIRLEPNDYVYLERDVGTPGALTKMTETPWYKKPAEWVRASRKTTRSAPAPARAPVATNTVESHGDRAP